MHRMIMEQDIVQKEEFLKRRQQKNKIVLGLIMGFVALIWAITMLKMQHGG
jgi:hypothetical protein